MADGAAASSSGRKARAGCRTEKNFQVELGAPFVVAKVFDPSTARLPGIGDENVGATEALRHTIAIVRHLRGVEHIAGGRPSTRSAPCCLVSARSAPASRSSDPAANRDQGALFEEYPGRGQPDAGRSARHDRYLVRKPEIHLAVLSLPGRVRPAAGAHSSPSRKPVRRGVECFRPLDIARVAESFEGDVAGSAYRRGDVAADRLGRYRILAPVHHQRGAPRMSAASARMSELWSIRAAWAYPSGRSLLCTETTFS